MYMFINLNAYMDSTSSVLIVSRVEVKSLHIPRLNIFRLSFYIFSHFSRKVVKSIYFIHIICNKTVH